MSLPEAVAQSEMSLGDRPEAHAYVIIPEWGLPFFKHTDKDLQVKGDFSRGGNIGSCLSRDEPDCYLKWTFVFVIFEWGFSSKHTDESPWRRACE